VQGVRDQARRVHEYLGEHAGRSFLAPFASGLVKGDGMRGALGDGAEGLLSGRVTEALAARAARPGDGGLGRRRGRGHALRRVDDDGGCY
jgi:hypothetical protein